MAKRTLFISFLKSQGGGEAGCVQVQGGIGFIDRYRGGGDGWRQGRGRW